jgi:uncharacterized protein (TIGR02996 family)
MMTERRPDLERSLIDAPFDPERLLVYADWLIEQGDARGELIQLQHARREVRISAEQRAAEAQLVFRHKRQLLPPMLASSVVSTHVDTIGDCVLGWELGFVRRANLRMVTTDPSEVQELVRQSLRHPTFRFVESMVIAPAGTGGSAERRDYRPMVKELAVAELPLLNHLELMDRAAHADLGDVSAVLRVYPRLASLGLRGFFELDESVRAPAVRRLHVTLWDEDLQRGFLQRVAAGAFGGVRELVLTSLGAVEDLAAALSSMPELTRLALTHTDTGDRIAAALGNASLPRLTELDLSHSRLSAPGARQLASSGLRLEVLDVRECRLPPQAEAYLVDLAGEVRFGHQRFDPLRARPPDSWRVRHRLRPAWGIGQVVEERDGKLTIDFEDGRRRRLVSSLKHLEVVRD